MKEYTPASEFYISVDIETDGPIPGRFSMLEIGAVVVGSHDGVRFKPAPEGETSMSFQTLVRPITDRSDPAALAATGFNREDATRDGLPAQEAMRRFSDWILKCAGDAEPVMVGYPAAFDWSFIYWYSMEFLGSSPFKHSRYIDVKSLYMGLTGCTHMSSGSNSMDQRITGPIDKLEHRALADAQEQGRWFVGVMTALQLRRKSEN